MLRRPLCGMAAGLIAGIVAAAYWERGWLPAGVAAAVICMCCVIWRVRRFRGSGASEEGVRAAAEDPLERCGRPGTESGRSGSGKRDGTGKMVMQRPGVSDCGYRTCGAGEVELPEPRSRLQAELRIACCIAMFLLGGFRYERAVCFRGEYQQYLTDGMPLLVQGELSSKKIQNDQYIYELKSCVLGLSMEHQSETVPVYCDRILVSSDSDIASIGETLVLHGTAELFEPATNEGGFDGRSYYESRGIAFRLTGIRLLAAEGKAGRLREWLWQLRLRLKEVYQNGLEPEEGGVLATMVLGDKDLLDAETKRLYQTGGLSHMMAISGLHISVIGMALYRFLRNRGLGFWIPGITAGGVMCAYGVMVGAGTSVQRAVLMFVLMLLSEAVGRSYDTRNALGLAALFLLWGNPCLLWDAGFQFSFAAVLGAAWVSGCLSFPRTRAGKAGGALFSGAAIQLATLPLAAWYYYEIPVYAILMNLLILPVMGVLLAAGIIGGIVGLLSLRIAGVALLPCQLLLSGIRLLCGLCAGLPGAVYVTGRPSLARMLIYYALLAAVTMWAYRRKRQESVCRRKEAGKGGTCAVLLFFVALLLVPPRRGFELDMLDVGQGDGCFVRTGQGHTIFVDGGSSSVRKVGEYRILPFLKYNGVRAIDCWIVSHADSDHISGLKELLNEGYAIRRLVFAEGIVRDEAHQELAELAVSNGTQLVYMDAGDSLYLGEARLRALFPSAAENSGTDRNAASLVCLYEEGAFTGLFTGDIGTAEESELLQVAAAESRTGEVTFYKAAHHGSDYSNSEELLQELRPQIAVVSCAEKNRYGHPGAEAVAHMEDAGSRIFYTMESGQIRITMRRGTVRVWTYADAETLIF